MPINSRVNLRAFERAVGSVGAPSERLATNEAVVAPSPDGGAPLLLGPKMRPRDEAIFWLSAAAEIEHALMAQYLFAAYSIDPESLPAENGVRRDAIAIRNRIHQISREEMGHLITVQNLLHIVGGPLHFGRQYSPFEEAIQPFRYRLEPITLDSLSKYVIAESPNRPLSEIILRADPTADALIKQKIENEIAPRAKRSNGDVLLWHVGAVFKRLRELFASELADQDFRVGRSGLQARWSDWGYEAPSGTNGGVVLVESIEGQTPAELRSRAVEAIAKIGEQGEAFDGDGAGEESHFERFLLSYEQIEKLEQTLGRPVSLPIAPNPNTTPAPPKTENIALAMGQDHLDAGRITNARALRWAELFNLRYRILLGCLQHSLLLDAPTFEAGDGTPQTLGDRSSKGWLQYWAFAEMRRIKKIAEKLVELRKDDQGEVRAGPPFELPYLLRLPHTDVDRWAEHADVFAMTKSFIEEEMLTNDEIGRDFLAFVAETDGRAAAISDALAKGASLPPKTHTTDFHKATHVLDEAVRGFPVPRPHQAFWREATRDNLVNDSGIEDFIKPGDPDRSKLIDRISRDQSDSGRMPRERPRIAPERIDFLRDWIVRGAPDNAPPNKIGIAGEPSPQREPQVALPPPPPPERLSFGLNIRPLFRDKDRNRMLFRFDLFVYVDVKQNAADILDAVESGRMPCDIPWDSEKVAKFRKWIDDGLLE
ncbi:hypothetical protein IYY11_01950 [Methylocystis sp. H62]|uniref:ferritin-like domain-containing protein n=1 Tax=Methylocystis sp. H62 TaxID=2785789 RepID=UPI0018C24134|nr:ferritin-like domain-containing protein [Methylocystis sp. H62]MBG0792238.1 hypothetical protein [Methylocystis sp. H62]